MTNASFNLEAMSSNFSFLLETSTVFAPSLPNASAMASPIPPEAPVISTTLSLNLFLSFNNLSICCQNMAWLKSVQK